MLTIALTMIMAISGPTTAQLPPGDTCNERDTRRTPWSRERRQGSRERVQSSLRSLGASDVLRAYHDAVVCRESFCGEAGVRHTLGEGEDGLGTHGLSLRWHAHKWPGEDEDPAFCVPEVSTVVAHEVIRGAVTRYGARNVVEIQAVYGGFARCHTPPDPWAWVERWVSPRVARWLRRVDWIRPAPERWCTFDLGQERTQKICGRMAKRGHSCWETVTEEDLGERIEPARRREWALSRAREWWAARG